MFKKKTLILPMVLFVEFGVLINSIVLYSHSWEKALNRFAGEVSPAFVNIIKVGSNIRNIFLYVVIFAVLIIVNEVVLKNEHTKKYLYLIIISVIIVLQNIMLLTIPLIYD